jgi:hypothetical protein
LNITVVDENVIACNNPKYHIVLTDIGKTVVKCSWDVLPDRQEWERQNGKEEDRISLIKKCHVVYDNLTQTLINSVKKDQTARSTCEETEKKAIQALRDLVDSLGIRYDKCHHRKKTVFPVDKTSLILFYRLCAGEEILELCDSNTFIVRLVPFVIHMMVGDLVTSLYMEQTEESDDRFEKTADKKCIDNNYIYELTPLTDLIIKCNNMLPDREKALRHGILLEDYDAFNTSLGSLAGYVYAYAVECDRHEICGTRYIPGSNTSIDRYLSQAMESFRKTVEHLGTKTHTNDGKKLGLIPCDTYIIGSLANKIRKKKNVKHSTKMTYQSNEYCSYQTNKANILRYIMKTLRNTVPDINLNKQREKKYDSEQRVPETISFDSTKNTLYICKGTISCRKKSHSIVSVTGILASLSGKPVKINVNYCKNCKLYFIDYSEYKYYQQIYGALLGNYRIQNSQKECEHAHDGLADESVLRIYGYTVNQNDGLTQEERRMILCNLMDRNIISKYRIIEYLQFFINNSRHRANMHSANQKWSDDLQWVRSYRIDNQRHFLIENIKQFR